MKVNLIASMIVLCLVFSVGLAQAQKCEPTTFSNVQPKTFDCMKTKLQDYGIYVPPVYNGELSGKGITASFLYDGSTNLTIQIKEKPLPVSCELAAREIKKFVEECQGS